MNCNYLWKSSALLKNLHRRAKIIFEIRNYFFNLGILEVETPILSNYSVTDVNFIPFKTKLQITKKRMWLVPSPEYHMKRLLVQNIGAIYQISRSFRNNEFGGPYHNPEFTMLEWYSPYCNMFDFMKKVEKFLVFCLKVVQVKYISYQRAFIKYLNIDPLLAKKRELLDLINKFKFNHLISDCDSISTLLEILFTLKIEPNLNNKKLIFVYHYPADQAILAAINDNDSRVSDRFEVFFKGVELGNGFYELTDQAEHIRRFKLNNIQRRHKGICSVEVDQFFLKSLSRGLPPCSGIAIGLDRLIMLSLNLKTINEVIAFPIERC
ncbi:putative lysyl-tRNA synthetase [Buchnera aphidicola str. Bp (Baizongia pistaciae)]|uniref:Elongation factor P--(R)-beta-lysine ligase n=1 Tax=Buchnera aphidicola subsp. Baizongia pistaciae (strain Bp) TaxID=224915 RepID=EPMA_BUCBP|nr:elongation factor P--(R)-beta-lysine ligase [Buchnera aphidicola]Q89A27.1 RecName: Full=Elongation factor P--(R)-beta-lysine ligase; Short=EF-P--(R)-beta-lysine ligase; AltName: Full=EF-P post-translational modification enzyme A; AltName: Full=EF-P-lysine lysyltransferase [Buchnera aphidicola str. Bp (Baizongia pistaciae)]AAO27230.1 putative lysyl-tRNA synthetase [Buchnera aphidicola str. Bp (Baizongia pistaciae)]